MEDAGLEVVVQEDVPLTRRYESFDEYWSASRELSRTLSVALETIDEQEAENVRADVFKAFEPNDLEGGGLAMPALTRITLARLK
jgi:hypothetical protein